jgi:mycobactin lysine-N-oxygenase
LKEKTLPTFGKLAIVGAGEQTASALHALTRYSSQFQIDVISPKGFIASRAESHYENQVYSQPEKFGWHKLSIKDRQDFINRTDLGVFSQQAISILNDEVHHAIIPGRVIHSETAEHCITLTLSYQQQIQMRHYDQVLLATGFDPAAMLLSLLSPRAKAKLIKVIGEPITRQLLTKNIGVDLSVQDFYPHLHLPMLAALMQGPGFANLSCLGRLSDRLMMPFLHEQSYSLNQKIIALKEAQ